MKVFVSPTCQPCSRAMHRVSSALREFAPRGVSFVVSPAEADLQVLHAIAMNARPDPDCKRYAVVQYCTTNASEQNAQELWSPASTVWSYYMLWLRYPGVQAKHYHAPLGVDRNIFSVRATRGRERAVLTSGYVNGPGAEAILPLMKAALSLGFKVYHLGPKVVQGMAAFMHPLKTHFESISDDQLARLYSHVQYVGAMRYIEGFELPAIEGLACGARPIVFDQPATRRWFSEFADFVDESLPQDELEEALRQVLLQPLQPVEHVDKLLDERFNWKKIVEGFWERAL